MGSAIVEEAVRRGLAVTCVTRTGTPAHPRAGLERVPGLAPGARCPRTYRDAMSAADAVVTSVGVLPLPSLTHEEVVRGNGDTNVVPARTAKGSGWTARRRGRVLPVRPRRGVRRSRAVRGGLRQEKMALAFARDEFVGRKNEARRAPTGRRLEDAIHRRTRAAPVDRHVPGVASAARRARERRSQLAPTPVGNVARAAVAAAPGKYAKGFEVIDNLRLLGEFDE